jgi:hypothetical protein
MCIDAGAIVSQIAIGFADENEQRNDRALRVVRRLLGHEANAVLLVAIRILTPDIVAL